MKIPPTAKPRETLSYMKAGHRINLTAVKLIRCPAFMYESVSRGFAVGGIFMLTTLLNLVAALLADPSQAAMRELNGHSRWLPNQNDEILRKVAPLSIW